MNKLSQSNVLETVTAVGSIGLGVAVSKGVNAITPVGMQTPLVKGGMAVVSVVGAALIPSKKGITKMGKNAVVGYAIGNAWSAISDLITPTLPTDQSSKAQKFIGAAFGLNGSSDGEDVQISREIWQQNANPGMATMAAY
jgi:hypothetical protein